MTKRGKKRLFFRIASEGRSSSPSEPASSAGLYNSGINVKMKYYLPKHMMPETEAVVLTTIYLCTIQKNETGQVLIERCG